MPGPLGQSLQAVSRAISARTTLPILNNILVQATDQGLALTATNLEIGIRKVVPAEIADEGFGTRPLPEVRGDAEFSTHLCESLIYEHEFDLTICQELNVEHGFLVPMNLCFEHGKDGWPVAAVPLQVNVIQHPLPTARRCYRLGQALRKSISTYPRDLRVVILGTGGMSHQLQGKRFGFMNESFDQMFLDQIEANVPGDLDVHSSWTTTPPTRPR